MRRLAATALLATLAACGPEPQDRPGTWQATGANDANLRAMIANPAHLTRGAEPVVPGSGERAAIAGDRLGVRPSGDQPTGIQPLPNMGALRVIR